MNKETECLHGGYRAKNGEPLALPIYQSTTYRYESTEHVGKLFDLAVPGHMYSRISNPTVELVEKKMAQLEGGVGAVLTSSGQSAVFLSLVNILGAGDHFIASSKIYGGTVNLFAVTMKRLGIECTFVDEEADEETLQRAFRPNTKAVFGETLANPALTVCDIEKFARVAHRNGVPLIIDNTFPTPVLCRPFEFGADIVVHSTTKYLDGHAVVVGGCVVDSGKFDWSGYEGLSRPDESYHGLVYTEAFGEGAYITKLRVQLVRDFGVLMSAQSAFLLDLGIQTLALRMERHSRNAEKVAQALEKHRNVEFVNYPALESSPSHALALKYLPNGCAGVISFSVAGSRERAIKFMDGLKLASNCVHVADVRTLVLHPASATHRQLTDEQLIAAGIPPRLVRLSVGIENVEDILEDVIGSLDRV